MATSDRAESIAGRVPFTPDFGGILAQLDWMEEAHCVGLQALFFSRAEDDRAKAIGICRRCPVLAQCQDWSRQVQPRCGVWAGWGSGHWR